MVGPQFGNTQYYTNGRIAGTVSGIATGIIIGIAGPGLVSCGTFAHKALVGWEVAEIAGGLYSGGSAAWDAAANGGEFGVLDGLAIAGAVLSIGSLKKLMNKCFVGDTGVVWRRGYVQTEMSTLDSENSAFTLSPFAISGGLLIAIGAGWYFLSREDEKKRKEREAARRVAQVDGLFSNNNLLNNLMMSVMDPSSKSIRKNRIPVTV